MSGSYTYTVASDYANRPVNYVSFWDSCRFANWLHNGQPTGAQGPGTTETGAYTLNGYNWTGGETIQRNAGWRWAITSEDEFYKAAYYKGGSTNAGYWNFATSSDRQPGRDLNDVSGNNVNYYGDPFPIQSPYYTTVVGEFQNSESPYGTFDQSGNVYEWNEAVLSGAYRGVRGGSFADYVHSQYASARSSYSPTLEGAGVGFRVVQVPEPGCALLLVVASPGLVSRRRRS
jgi:formylglycine-generating enzyme